MKKMLLALALMVFCGVEFANSQITRVPATYDSPGGSVLWNGKLYFGARDTVHGDELWSYDGITPPKMVDDLNTGIANGLGDGVSGGRMAIFKNKLYLNSRNDSSENGLFAYNGGTTPRVKVPGTGLVFELTAYGSKLYYVSRDSLGMGRNNLYSYDGVNPPHMYPPLAITGTGYGRAFPFGFKGKVYCIGAYGELDAIDTTTNILSEYVPGARTAGPFPADNTFMVAGNKLYFIATDGIYGNEIWSYDGTTMTRRTDLAPGLLPGANYNLAYYNGEIYFNGSVDGSKFQLYKIDTGGGAAKLVYTVNPSGDASLGNMIVYKNNLYFTATTPATGRELWKYNGTTCSMVADLYPGSKDGLRFAYGIGFYGIYKGHLYFVGTDGVHSDGVYRFEMFRLNDPTGIQNVSWSGDVFLHPNPATASATLSITLKSLQSLLITLTDVSGKEVFKTAPQSFTAGRHDVILPTQNLAAGQYFYRISDGGTTTLARGTVVKQ